MKILELQRHLRHDVVQVILDTAVRDQANRKLQTLETRFACEGWPFLSKLTDAYKAAMGGFCQSGDIPSVLPHLGAVVCDGDRWGDRAKLRFLACLSWPSKLTFAGESEGLADWSGFRERSIECNNFVGCTYEDIIPMSRSVRSAISRRAGFRAVPLKGKHGPGSTAERLRAWDKWLSLEEPTRPIIRMSSVPKDRSKRRLIGIEHAKMQFVQQGLAASLRSTEWFRKWVNLEDQEQHVKFAQIGSFKESPWGDPLGQCTIDLSDASDRIPLGLVEYLLPDWYPWLACASSSYADLSAEAPRRKNGALFPLGMMATMGCGFCFELETLVFHIVASLAGRMYDEESGLVPWPLEHYAARCRVYGDDVIVPVQWFPVVERVFSQLGWRISYHKTALTSRFLETCGTYIVPDRAQKRFCPTLQTADKYGAQRDLAWDSTQARLDTAKAALEADLPGLASAVAKPVLKTARFRWNPHGLQRIEIKLSSVVATTRVLNVVEQTRLDAYWICGLVDQREEDCGKTTLRSLWVPWREYSCLATLASPVQSSDWLPVVGEQLAVSSDR